MKFLTIGTFKDVYYTLPQDERQKLGVAQSEYNLETKKKMGDKWHFYGVPGWDRMLESVCEVGSMEELSQMYQGAPIVAAGFWKHETYPLVELDEKAMEASLERYKAAK